MPFITTVRARLRSTDPEEAKATHNASVADLIPRSRPLGASGHRVYRAMDDPQAFLAVDSWDSMEGLQQFMGDPSVQAEIGKLFDGPPDVTVWEQRDGWTTY